MLNAHLLEVDKTCFDPAVGFCRCEAWLRDALLMRYLILPGVGLWLMVISQFACVSKSDQQNETNTLSHQLNHAYILVDQGKDTDAIELLTSLQRQGFSEPEVSV